LRDEKVEDFETKVRTLSKVKIFSVLKEDGIQESASRKMSSVMRGKFYLDINGDTYEVYP